MCTFRQSAIHSAALRRIFEEGKNAPTDQAPTYTAPTRPFDEVSNLSSVVLGLTSKYKEAVWSQNALLTDVYAAALSACKAHADAAELLRDER